MPTTNRRLHVTLTPELSKAMERLSKGMGKPMAAVVRDLLLEALPTLQALADALELAQSKPRQAVDAMTLHALRTLEHASGEMAAAHQRALPLPEPRKSRKKRGRRR